MRILVTGMTGFAGSHLAEALLARGYECLFGSCLSGKWSEQCSHLAARIPIFACDLTNGSRVEEVLRETRPDAILHLAGYANTGMSYKDPDGAWTGNLTATRSLYEAVIRWGGKPRILFVGSGLVYGDSEGDEQLDEQAPLRPVSPYAASKAAADLASYQYFRSPGLDIIRVRPFNHIGARQSPQFAVAHFAKQIAAIEKGKQPPVLETGNLSPRRDISDVRDVASAYILLMEKGRPGEAYNLGTGQSKPMQSLLDRLLSFAKVRIEVRQQAGLVRGTEVAAVCANAAKLRRETGWQPRHDLDSSLRDVLDFWRGQDL